MMEGCAAQLYAPLINSAIGGLLLCMQTLTKATIAGIESLCCYNEYSCC
jgi:hypothetical protein